MTTIGDRRHLITLQNPGPPVPTGTGYTQTWTDLVPPTMFAKIDIATGRDLERQAAGTILSAATHIVTMPYHPGVTTKTRIIFEGRTLNVTGVGDPDERHVETVAVCVEQVH